MTATALVHDALAELFEYPRDGGASRVRRLAEMIAAEVPEAGADLEPLVRFAAETDLGAREESYVGTFDANAERALEVGWQVFGEQYARGAFLVALRGRMRDLGVAESSELPDHLTHVLRLMGRMTPAEAGPLAENAVLPSLRRVRADLDEGNVYAGLVDAALKVVAQHAGADAVAAVPPAATRTETPRER